MRVRKGRNFAVTGLERGLVHREPERKTRNDKKRDIKPTISIESKDQIYRLSYIMTIPVKDVCELMIKYATKDSSTLDMLSKYFKRGVWFNETLYHGSSYNESISKLEHGITDRIHFRVRNELYDKISGLSYALDCSISRTCAILMYETLTDRDFINNCVSDCALDASRSRELRLLYSQLIFR